MKRFIYIAVLVLAACSCIAKDTVRLATTTSTYDTGLLDSIIPPFEEQYDIKVHVISVGTGKAIKLAENGDVDIILVHAREAEDKFIEDGHGIDRRDVMYNDFVILGPENDPAKVAQTDDIADALRAVAAARTSFVSRGDDSGTHKKEVSLWENAEIKPSGSWHMEVGQGMAAALRVADEKGAYILIDRGTYLSQKNNIRLVIVSEGDVDLKNPYGVIRVNPSRHKHVQEDLALKLSDWLVSGKCQKLIGEFRKNGEILFHPSAISKSKLWDFFKK